MLILSYIQSLYVDVYYRLVSHHSNKNKRILYCDIDSTVNNHWERIKKWAIGNRPPRKIDPKAFSEKEVLKDNVAFNSSYWINEFKKAGWEIHWLSARPYYLYKATELWLKKNNFPVDSIKLVNTSADKFIYLQAKQVDLFVDDFTKGQENDNTEVYEDVIALFEKSSIPFVVFKGDWEKIFNEKNNLR